jgi:hypothetical protein
VEGYRRDVEARAFPNDGESYHLPKDVAASLENLTLYQKA